MKKDRTLTLLTIRKVRKNDKITYHLKAYKHYPRVSLYKALYLSDRCTFFGRLPETNKIVHPLNQSAKEILGISDSWKMEFTFAVINKIKPRPVLTEDTDGLGNLAMFCYDEYHPQFSQKDIKRVSHVFDQLEKRVFLKKTFNYLKDASYWGAIASIPRGWQWIKSGEVILGDYYWDDHTHNNGHWTKCEVSYSSMKPGKLIENRRSAHVKTGKTGVQHVLHRSDWYNGFIIRKLS